MTLEVNHVTGMFARATMEEVILSHFVQGGRGGEGGDVTADALVVRVPADHHHHGIPANDAFDASFHFPIARETHLFGMVDGVDIGSIGGERQHHATGVGAFLQ